MPHSARYSYVVLRIGLAVVFLWFGIDKFFHPSFWLNAWVPHGLIAFVERFSIGPHQLLYVQGIFEVLVGLSMATGVFTKFFAACASLFLIGVLIFAGQSDITVRDIGLLSGFIAIFLWPEERNR